MTRTNKTIKTQPAVAPRTHDEMFGIFAMTFEAPDRYLQKLVEMFNERVQTEGYRRAMEIYGSTIFKQEALVASCAELLKIAQNKRLMDILSLMSTRLKELDGEVLQALRNSANFSTNPITNVVHAQDAAALSEFYSMLVEMSGILRNWLETPASER